MNTLRLWEIKTITLIDRETRQQFDQVCTIGLVYINQPMMCSVSLRVVVLRLAPPGNRMHQVICNTATF